MKKVLCLLMVLVMALGCAGITASAAEYGIVLNNNAALMVGSTVAVAGNALQTLSAAPVSVEGEVLIPLDAVSVLLNGSVSSDGRAIDMQFGTDKTVTMRVDSKQYMLNGRMYDIAVAPQAVNGSLMVPVRVLAQDVIGKTVFFDATNQLMVISSRRVLKDSVTDAAVISTIASAIRTNNLPEITVPTYYEIDWSSVTGGAGGANYDTGKLNFVSIAASAEPEPNNGANNVNDGSTSSFWAIGDVGGTIICDLGKVNAITEIKVAFEKYTQRGANYEIQVSENGNRYESIYAGTSMQGQQWVSHSVNGAYRYVKLISNGNTTGSSFNSIAEIQAFNGGNDNKSNGNTQVLSFGGKLKFLDEVKATDEPQAENNAHNAIDGNPDTYWAVEGENSITADLGSVKEVSGIGVQMRHYDDGRTIDYSLSYSSDGTNYTTVYEGQSAVDGGVIEQYPVSGSIRYVKVTVKGSGSTSNWSSVAEIEAYGPAGTGDAAGDTATVTGSKLNIVSAIATSEPESDNNAAKAIDGNADTFWATSNAQTLTLDLGAAQEISAVGVQMRKYTDGRSVKYSVSYSSDGSSYQQVYDGASAGGGGVMETHNVGASARYVRIGVNGSTQNEWASVAMVEVYGSAMLGAAGYKNLSSVSGSFMLAVQGTTNVLTVGSDGVSLSVSKGTKASNQMWSLSGANITNNGTGRCLDVSEASYDEGAAVCVWDNNGGSNQSWSLEKNGEYYLVKSNHSGHYLTVSGGSLQQRGAASATKWVVTNGELNAASIGGGANQGAGAVAGAFKNKAYVSGNFMIALKGTTSVITVGEDGKTVMLSYGTNDGRQLWSVNKSALKNRYTGNYLAIANDGEGSTVCADIRNDPAWVLEEIKDGYLIKNKGAGLYLTLVGSSLQLRGKDEASAWVITGGELVTEADVAANNAGTTDADKVTTDTTVVTTENMANISGNFVIKDYGSNNVLTVGDDNFTLSVGAYTNNGKQQWTLDGASVKNNGTGLFLDVSGQSYDEGGQICVWEGNGGDNQKWTFENQGDYYLIKSNMSGLYLAVSGGNVQQRIKDDATKWVISNGVNTSVSGAVTVSTEPANKNMSNVAGEFIVTAYGSNNVLTVGGDNFTLSVGAYTNNGKQQWTLDGASVKNNATGFFLDVSGQSYDEGGQICVWEGNGGDNQKWTFENQGDYYLIKSNMSGLYLTVSGGNVQQRIKDDATKWVITAK